MNLEKSYERRRTHKYEVDEQNDTIIMTFMRQAFTILLSWIIASLYYNVIVVHWAGSRTEVTQYKMVVVRISWLVLCLGASPACIMWTKNANLPGFRPQTMFQNLFGLFGFSIMMFNSWAFKDTVIAIVGFGTPPTNCLDKTLDGAECESSSLSERIEWFFWMLAMALACTVAGTVKGAALQLYIHAVRKNRGRGYWTKKLLIAQPWALGTGYAWNLAWESPFKSFSYYIVKTTDSDSAKLPRVFFFKILSLTMLVPFVLIITRWFSKVPVPKKFSITYEFVKFFVKSMTFCVAWNVADNLYFLYFEICFSCAPPYSKCEDMTMFLNVLYAGIMVVSAVLLVPVLKENMQMLARIKGFYSKELMPEDTSRLKMQDVETQMILKIFTISNLNTKHSASSCSKD